MPPKVAAADGAATPGARLLAGLPSGGQTREYWIAAEPVEWNIVPTHRDQMMAEKVKQGKTTFGAYGYRAYSAGFKSPLGKATVPGPLIDAEVGDTVVVHFRNKLGAPATMHPHGIFYANEMDGAYKGKWTDPGGFVQRNRTFTYVWEAREGTEGTWLYHDHGPMDPLPTFKGLFGPLVIRKRGEARPDNEFFLAFHTFDPSITGLRGTYYCVNGKAYAGNTPTLEAQVGQRVAFHVYGVDNFFHTFHLHGHRWSGTGRPHRRQQDLRPGRVVPVRVRRGQPRPLVLPLPRLPAPAPGDERLVPRLLRATGRVSVPGMRG